jgi:hypothetical protein
MSKLFLVAAVVLAVVPTANAQTKSPRPGCDTFAMTGIPYAGNRPEACADHSDHFRSIKVADWENMRKNEIELKAQQAAAYLLALEYMAKLNAARVQISR